MGGGHHHLYAGRSGYNARGFGHPMPSADLGDVTAPNSLASLDPHAGGTLAAAAAATPTVNNQEEVYEYNGSGSIQI